MQKNARVILFLLLVQAWFPSAAQRQCSLFVSGIVTDAASGLPVAQARITAGIQAAETDRTGFYRLGPLCPGAVVLLVHHLGYTVVADTLLLEADLQWDMALMPAVQELEELQVVDVRPEPAAVQPVSRLYAGALQETRGESLGEALRHLAGVSVLQTGPSIAKPLIHGLTGNRILILNNGVRQEGQQWGNEHAPEIDPFIAGELVVIKGADCVRFGSDAIGGVIRVDPKPLSDSAGLNAELNVLGMSNNREGIVSAIVEQRLAGLPLAWRLQGTAKQAGAARTPDYYLQNSAYREGNFSATAGWNTYSFGTEVYFSRFSTTLGIFSGAHQHNLTDLQQALEQPRPSDTLNSGYRIDRPYQQVLHDLLKVQAFTRRPNGSKWTLMMAGQYNRRSEYDKHGPRNDSLAQLNRPELLFNLNTHNGELSWERSFSRKWFSTAGLGLFTQHNTYSGRYFIPFYRTHGGALFFIQRYRRSRTEWEAGLRFDYRWMQVKKYEDGMLIKPQFTYHRLNVHAGMLWRITDHADLHLHLGTAWRPPSVNELYSSGLHHGVAALEYGNPDLQPEQAYSGSVSLDVHDHHRLAGELTLYHTRIENFIYLRPQLPPQLTIQGAFPVFVYDQTYGVFSGVDAACTVQLTDAFSIVPRAALVYARDRSHQDYLPLMPPHQGSLTLRWAPEVFAGITEPFAALTVEHVLQQRRVPDDGDFAPPPPAYTLMSAVAGASWRIGRQQLQMQLTVTNLTNLAYRNYLNRFRYYADEMGRNVMLRLTLPVSANNLFHNKIK